MSDKKPTISFLQRPNLEADDYYIEKETGFLVFTTQYHLKRGYCCKNGCRHCPYGFRFRKEKS
ncbi:MAG: DUF5522 domain-containing protein [Spirosomataceae bacterium]